MNEIEKLVWAAAFALEHHKEYHFIKIHGLDDSQGRTVSGFYCGEIADEALKSFREAMHCEDTEYLDVHKLLEKKS